MHDDYYNPTMMEMAVVIFLVAVAAAYVAWTVFRAMRGTGAGCGAGCGCGTKADTSSDRLGTRHELIQLGTSPSKEP